MGRYTHRVAISNRRILKLENGNVTFSWRDYKDENKVKEMEVSAEEFIRRFLLHILPDGFMKIRYYGILSSRNKKENIKKCKELLGCKEEWQSQRIRKKDLLEDMIDEPEIICPCCRKGIMRTKQLLLPDKPSPPGKKPTSIKTVA